MTPREPANASESPGRAGDENLTRGQINALLPALLAGPLISGACRTPVFCALFVVEIAGNLPLASLGDRVRADTWNEVQLEQWLEDHRVNE